MNVHGLENDFLDLIEGRLSDDRVPAVRAALERDPNLARLLDRMRGDRRGIVELGRATEQAARADGASAEDLIREAIARAERETLVGAAPRAHRRRRWTPIAAAAALLLGVGLLAGGLTYLTLAREDRQIRSDLKRMERAQQGRIEEVSPDPAQPGEGTVLASGEGGASPTVAPKASLPSWINLESDPSAVQAVRKWTMDASRTSTRGPEAARTRDELAASALQRISAGGSARLSLEEAAALAVTRRLRLHVPRGGVDWSRRRAEALAHAGRSAEPIADLGAASASSPELDEVRVTLRSTSDPELAGLRDALADLQQRLEGASGAGWFELDQEDEHAAGALPSLDLGDILWWSNEPSAWTPGTSVEVRVVFGEASK